MRYRWVIYGLVFIGIVATVAQEYSRESPHGTQAECGPHAKPDCACPKIVSDIQVVAAEKCHERVLEPKELRGCLGRIPSHCDIMRDGHNMPEYDKYLRDEKGTLKMCGTQCYHKKCKCGDQPCKDRMGTYDEELSGNTSH